MRSNCTNNLSKIIKPVGLLSIDEYNFSRNNGSYLISSQNFWYLTPNDSFKVWRLIFDGINRSYSVIDPLGVRPVVNIQSDVTIVGGNGNLTDPYIVKENNNVTENLNNHSHIGEYVTYAGRNYRVVEPSLSGTKLILDGYYDQNNDGIIEESDKMSYGTNCTLCTTINEESFINWISNIVKQIKIN